MKTLVIGASGQVGAQLEGALRARGHEVIATHRGRPASGTEPLDLRDEPAVARLLRRIRAEAVFCPAGATHVDGCEEDPAAARAANVTGPLTAAEAAGPVPFVYFSTEYVFDGERGPYHEGDRPNPLSVYGRTKLEAEQALAARFPRAVVVRTCGVFGPEPQGKNFVYQLRARLSRGERMRVPADQVSTPTYGPDLARACVDLVEGGAAGVVHVAGPIALSRAALAALACRALGLPESLLDPVPTAALGQKARRPLRAGLLVERLRALGIAAPRPPAEGLAELARHLAGLQS
ncbi:MAG: SDR family oxidoreductase [Planctomycetales bacterium]|nr:SDR family oxidoreductase [Planctomycetales bacterium]